MASWFPSKRLPRSAADRGSTPRWTRYDWYAVVYVAIALGCIAFLVFAFVMQATS